MTSQQILQSDLLDILFEGRNKLYGAYLLRRSYPAQLLKAMGTTALLVVALVYFGGPPTTKAVGSTKADSVVLSTAILPPEVKPKPPHPQAGQASAPRPPVATAQFIENIEVVDEPDEPVVSQEESSEVAVGSNTVAGPPLTGMQPPALPPATGVSGTDEPKAETEAPALPNRQPQFPGGTEAWLKFLSRYLMPPADLEAGEKRSVLVRFSVDAQGVVTNFVVVQSGGADFDNEVIRVLKKMPRWLPAVQQGRPVATNFTQPVTFVAPE